MIHVAADRTSRAGLVDVSVIIPTLDAAHHLPQALAACVGVREIIVVDGGSRDETVALASRLGARIVLAEPGRGVQLRRGAAEARGAWLLFLHADTVLTGGWSADVLQFIAEPANRLRAATFRFALNDSSAEARRLERRVAWRVRHLGLAYGDQGLLIHRDLYRGLGGFRSWPLMEDVDLVRRVGRRRLTVLSSAVHTSAERWRTGGWRRRSLRNLGCLLLYFLGVSPHRIARLYSR